uniref:ACT domain-containing protein n=1 Tax=Caenorhabditis tropicalis TaxID=1561998 RepID=A0A1I7TPG6_9PELO
MTDMTIEELRKYDGVKNELIETANEWETQFNFKYLTVGRLVKNNSEKADDGKIESLDSIINGGTLHNYLVPRSFQNIQSSSSNDDQDQRHQKNKDCYEFGSQ